MTERAVPDEGFLRRWARRKTAQRTADAPADDGPPGAAPWPTAPGAASSVHAASPPVPGVASAVLVASPPAPGAASSVLAASASVSGDRTAAAVRSAPPAHAPSIPGARTATATGSAPSAPARLPTLDDAAQLTADSDFSAFVARGVDAAVRRTALKKLFADPHFNAMDGLDVYIGDYTQPSPMSDAMLASLAHARQVLRRTVDAEVEAEVESAVEADKHAAPATATHAPRQQSPEPGHDEHPPDRRTDDA